jgi:uroporphyrinogen decarboxylase
MMTAPMGFVDTTIRLAPDTAPMTESTPRQRIRAALRHEPSDRTPFAWGFGLQPSAYRDLDRHLFRWDISADDYIRRTGDIRKVLPAFVEHDQQADASIWGYTWRDIDYGAGVYREIDRRPLAEARTVADIERHRWPDPNDFRDNAVDMKIAATDPDDDHAILLGIFNPFEQLTWMMGMEHALMALATEPDVIRAGLRRITDFFLELGNAFLAAAAGRIDILFLGDDLGTQSGPMIAPGTYWEVIQPFHAELCEMAHRHGAFAMYHTDGAVSEFVDDLIDAGADCLEAVQVECPGMAPHDLKRRFGGELAFHGAVSVQQLLPTATPDAVRQEVELLAQVLGDGGGYVCAPSHAIQAGTPPENVVAMVEAATGLSVAEIAKNDSE